MSSHSSSNEENRRYRHGWTDQELLIVLDLYFNRHETDSHGHEAVARCLGRYNANTRSYNDGAVNLKLSEIKGLVERSRMPGIRANGFSVWLKNGETGGALFAALPQPLGEKSRRRIQDRFHRECAS